MHSLNGENVDSPSPNTDEDLKGTWGPIQIEFFYCLTYNKPAGLIPSLDGWRINLQLLSLDSLPDGDAAVPTVTFLVNSRLASFWLTSSK
ncbi:hypothetical protein H9L39_17913 [Fusarium oxysporum f. sp. albedinis]|nr:hypothetical protein H9L39_17913 [Fusarium oxysporum f. sp. albedinis]